MNYGVEADSKSSNMKSKETTNSGLSHKKDQTFGRGSEIILSRINPLITTTLGPKLELEYTVAEVEEMNKVDKIERGMFHHTATIRTTDTKNNIMTAAASESTNLSQF